jgi:beta-glucanase (GH16 family)
VARLGEVSQSFQVAPFNYQYQFNNASPATTIYDSSVTYINSYKGGAFQQAVSGVSAIDSDNYNNNAYTTYGYEYWSNPSRRKEGYITWFSQGKQTWKITTDTVGPDSTARISERIIPEEPMVGLSPVSLFRWC